MAELLLEVGCEEVPAGAMLTVLSDLKERVAKRLEQAALGSVEVEVLGTPRRLAIAATGLLARQADRRERVVGPPVAAGAKAADGFARKVGLAPSALAEVDTDKGRRFVADLDIPGKAAEEVLPEVLTEMIAELPWPKSMRWGRGETLFVRPIRWILCVLDAKPLELSYAGVTASNLSYGHRFLAPGAFAVRGVADWKKALSERHVIVDPQERKQAIIAELDRVQKETGLTVRPDENLLDEVNFLVEFPVAVSGSFDEAFLRVPEAVITSAMRSHQRYFALAQADGKLANRFVTIAGTKVRDRKVVAAGNERVLRARLKDAAFFYDEDRKVLLATRAERLVGIVWVKGLGTMADKTERLVAIGRSFAKMLELDAATVSKVERAGRLAKADLLTHLVGEFPDLQGFVGSTYAKAAGEDPEVALALGEHYAPRTAKDGPATGKVGAVLAIADRIDSLVGCFSAGLVPTGSADPYALRRASLGVLQTLFAHNWDLSLEALIQTAATSARFEKKVDPASIGAQLLSFFEGRLRVLLGQSYPADVVDAVLAAGSDRPLDAKLRTHALAKLRAEQGFEPLGIAIKRVSNILKSSDGTFKATGSVDDKAALAVLSSPAEVGLLAAASRMAERVPALVGSRKYDEALAELSSLKQPVDTFFEKVLVMDPDEAVRLARLSLLAKVHNLFLPIADFGRLSVGT